VEVILATLAIRIALDRQGTSRRQLIGRWDLTPLP
jgi:hypothetical protein